MRKAICSQQGKLSHFLRIVLQAVPAAATLIISLIALTPLCGLYFGCGCTWPWSGFFFGCNYFDPAAEHRCPWCASPLAGWFSAGLSVILGMIASRRCFVTPIRWDRSNYLTRIATGVLIFLCTAILSGWIAAHGQHYPLAPLGTGQADLKPRQ